MGRHAKKSQAQHPETNPTGFDNEGVGPVPDTYTRRAVIDSWNIDAAYEKAKGEENGKD